VPAATTILGGVLLAPGGVHVIGPQLLEALVSQDLGGDAASQQVSGYPTAVRLGSALRIPPPTVERLLAAAERRLEDSRWRAHSAHYMAVLRKPPLLH